MDPPQAGKVARIKAAIRRVMRLLIMMENPRSFKAEGLLPAAAGRRPRSRAYLPPFFFALPLGPVLSQTPAPVALAAPCRPVLNDPLAKPDLAIWPF